MIKQLPPESSFSTQYRIDYAAQLDQADHDPELEQWSRTEHLLAAVVESVRELSGLYHVANFEKPHPEFDPIPRPGVAGVGGKSTALDEDQQEALHEYLRAMHNEQ